MTKHERVAQRIEDECGEALLAAKFFRTSDIAALLAEEFPEPAPPLFPRNHEKAFKRIEAALDAEGSHMLSFTQDDIEAILREEFPEPEAPFLTAAHREMMVDLAYDGALILYFAIHLCTAHARGFTPCGASTLAAAVEAAWAKFKEKDGEKG